ncbi:MAG: TRAP transporter substrate-binding protein [Acidobacteria bacterium]|nr:TRAP transporter substrate-binding protein [Acidobacteriota bacterium]
MPSFLLRRDVRTGQSRIARHLAAFTCRASCQHGRRATPGVLVLVLVLANVSCSQQQVLRYAHSNSVSDIPGQYANLLATLVAEKTGGALRIEVYPSSQLGGVREMIEAAQLGIIDMGHYSFAALSPFLPEIAVFNFPYLYENVDHALAATDPATSAVARELNARLIDRSNLGMIGSYFFGVRRLTTSGFPVFTPADLRGRKIRAIPIPLWIAMVQGMGAIPTPVDFSELPTALATGMVHGQENPVNTIYAARIHETQEYLMLTDHMIDINLVYMNHETLEALPPAHRRALLDAHRQAAAEVRRISEELQDSLVRKLGELGMQVISPENGLDVAAFRTAVTSHVRQTFPDWEPYIDRIRAIAPTPRQ